MTKKDHNAVGSFSSYDVNMKIEIKQQLNIFLTIAWMPKAGIGWTFVNCIVNISTVLHGNKTWLLHQSNNPRDEKNLSYFFLHRFLSLFITFTKYFTAFQSRFLSASGSLERHFSQSALPGVIFIIKNLLNCFLIAAHSSGVHGLLMAGFLPKLAK